MMNRANGYVRRGCGYGFETADRFRRDAGCTHEQHTAGTKITGTTTGSPRAGRNMDNGCRMREELMALYFVMTELELYLDGHPDNCGALARYECTAREYEEMAVKYEEMYGPLLARNNGCTNEWLWVKEPWPWEV